LNILLTAYNCSPEMGSEHYYGNNIIWNLAESYPKHHFIVVTRTEFKNKIEIQFKGICNIKFHYVLEPELNLRAKRVPPMLSFHLTYHLWERKVLKCIKEIQNNIKLDFVHKLNIIGYSYLGDLFKLENVKVIAGPLSGYENIKYEFLKYLTFGDKIFYAIRFLINFRNRIKTVKTLNTENFYHILVNDLSLEKRLQISKSFFFDSFCIDSGNVNASVFLDNPPNKLKILLAARWVSRKGILFLERILPSLNPSDIEFILCNDGPCKKGFIEKLQSHGFTFLDHGFIKPAELDHIMRKSDVLCYPSFLDANTNLIPQAISNGLPVVCFDINSYSKFLDDDVSYKVNLSSNLENDFAKTIEEISKNRELLKIKKHNTISFVKRNSYLTAVNTLANIYQLN
jgi:glycosyltransferase involved in cell wall biosynthesis